MILYFIGYKQVLSASSNKIGSLVSLRSDSINILLLNAVLFVVRTGVLCSYSLYYHEEPAQGGWDCLKES